MSIKDFAKILREQREQAGYTQTDISKKLFLARSTYNHFEAGKRIPSVENILRIASIYRIDPMILIAPFSPDKTISNKNPQYSEYENQFRQKPTSSDIELLSRFHSLTDDEQSAVTNMINLLHNAHSEIH